MPASQSPVRSLQEAKELWMPKTNFVNLNAGATSQTPTPVLEIANHWRRKISTDPVGVIWAEILSEIEANRAGLAKYLNVTSTDLLLFPNTTYAINTILRSIPWEQGTEIVITDQEYHHYLPLITHLAEQSGVKIVEVILPSDPESTPHQIVESFASALTPKTRYIFASHVTSQTGYTIPAKEIATLARQQGVKSIIDGAHAPGLVATDLAHIDADFYAGNVHKWLMGAVGSAFLHVRRNMRGILQPLIATAEAFYDQALQEESIYPTIPTPSYWAYGMEYQGTQDRSALTTIQTALDLRAQLSEEAIQDQYRDNRRTIVASALQRQLNVVSPGHPELASAMVAMDIPSADRIQAWKWFREHGFDVSFPKWKTNRNIMRLSGAWYVNPEDIENFFAVFDQCPWDGL